MHQHHIQRGVAILLVASCWAPCDDLTSHLSCLMLQETGQSTDTVGCMWVACGLHRADCVLSLGHLLPVEDIAREEIACFYS